MATSVVVWRVSRRVRHSFGFGRSALLRARGTDAMLICSVAANVADPGAWFFLTDAFLKAAPAATRQCARVQKAIGTPVETGVNAVERKVLRLLGDSAGVRAVYRLADYHPK